MGTHSRTLKPIHGSRRHVSLCGGSVWQKYVDGVGWVIDSQVTQYDLPFEALAAEERQRLQDRRAREIEPKGQAAVGYWSQATDAIIACPECARKLVAPSERAGMVRCPKCLAAWRLMPHELVKPLRARDTVADRPLHDMNDTLAGVKLSHEPTWLARLERRLLSVPHAWNAVHPNTLIAAVCAELDRRQTPYRREDVHAFVTGNYPALTDPCAIADMLPLYVEWRATGLWDGEAPIDMCGIEQPAGRVYIAPSAT